MGKTQSMIRREVRHGTLRESISQAKFRRAMAWGERERNRWDRITREFEATLAREFPHGLAA